MSAEAGEVSEPASQTSRAGRISELTGPGSSPWVRAGAVVLATRVVFMTIAFAASYYLSPDTHGTPARGFFEIWANHEPVTFPLWSPVARAVGVLTSGGPVAGLLVSALASWVALAYLYRLAELDEPTTGRPAVLYLALWPAAVLLIAPSGESLFLAGAVAAFYYARRSRWYVAGLLAALALSLHFAGIFLVGALIVEFIVQRRLRSAAASNEWAYATYVALALAAAAFGTVYTTTPSILATLFPIPVWIARVTKTRPRLHEVYVVATTALMTIAVAVYTRGEWSV